MTALAYAAATILGFNLGLIAAAVHAYRAEQRDRREVDELCALIDATAEPVPLPPEVAEWMGAPVEVAQMHRESTPLADAAMDFLRRSMAELDGMDDVADFLLPVRGGVVSEHMPTAEKDAHLVVSRRGIVHVVWTLDDDAATACGKGSRDLVLIGAVGVGERMCHSCARIFPPAKGDAR